MNKIQIFNYNSSEVRTIQKEGEPWFVLKDVCEVLGMSNSRMVAERLDGDEVSRTYITDSLGRQQHTTIINESGLYNVILRSDKPEAKPFRKWITSEVLPTIRKTGGYVSNEQTFVDTYLPFADDGTKALFSQTLAALRQASAKIEADKPKVLFADSVSASHTSILVGELAKLIKQNGVDIGQNRLFEWMRNNGFLIRRKGTDFNMPTQRSVEMGLFEIKETAITHSDGHISVNKTPKVTGKGQLYFVERFLGDTL